MTDTRTERVDVAVAGDGLIGLACAFHLLRAGLRVAVVGADRPGRASTAAAGMLTPACEYDPWMPKEFLDLLNAGLRYYPEFLSGWTTQEDVGYRSTDFTLLDLVEREESVKERMDWMPGLGFDCRWLPAAEVSAREPHLAPASFTGAIRILDEAVVNPVALWERLGADLTAHGAPWHRSGLAGVDEQGTALVVRTGDGRTVVADRLVIAAGSWSTTVGRSVGVDLPVCPVKGQMIRLSGPADQIGSVVFMPTGGCGSVVQRAPGVYVAGTSEEYAEPTAGTSAGVVGVILHRLTTVIPAAANWRVEEMWSGFRPMTGDELPVLGPAEDPRIHIATGHHRNGVLLAPLTGRLVAESLSGTGGALDLSPFAPGRPFRPHSRFADKY